MIERPTLSGLLKAVARAFVTCIERGDFEAAASMVALAVYLEEVEESEREMRGA